MKRKIRIAVVEDQLLVRQGIISLLKEHERFKVVIGAGNGKELLEALKTQEIDVVITDLEMPVMDGAETTLQVRAKYPAVKIIALTQHDEESFIVHLIEKGANGFLLKDYDIELLIDAIYSVQENGYYFNDRVSKAMVTGLVKNNKITPFFKKVTLTDKEKEILVLISKEFTTKEIADKLFLSKRTIEGYRDKIISKLNVKNTIGAVMYGVKNKIIEP